MDNKKFLQSMIAPSIMCADLADIKGALKALEDGGAEYLHVDIMDGSFVPNFTLGTDFCRMLKRNCNIPLDIHLMINSPEEKLGWFPISEGDFVSIHTESTECPEKALEMIRKIGGRPMIAINPGTPISNITSLLDFADAVLVMAVNPGFAGQKMLPGTLEKISSLREHLDLNGHDRIRIEVDGNVSFENAALMKKAGADIFVAGSSSVFRSDLSLDTGMKRLREVICG